MKSISNNLLVCLFVFHFGVLRAQFSESNKSGLKININGEENRYIRFILFGQVWAQANENQSDLKLDFSVRRIRLITYAQINPDFLIFMHVGLNSLNSEVMTPTGIGNASQLFLHDAWLEYKLIDEMFVGAGLHYWNGISRQNNGATLSLMTLDMDRSSWSTIGLSDQFVRHIGIYTKGLISERINYQASINGSLTNTLQISNYENAILQNQEGIFYSGKKEYGSKANINYSGYFEYYLFDKEVNKLPYRVGTYLGTKSIFNIGTGFFHHPKGVVELKKDASNNLLKTPNDVTHLALDVFYDAPLGDNNSAINFYGKVQYSEMGKNYIFSDVVGTGNTVYGHLGYLIPKSEKTIKNRYMPYTGYSLRDFNGMQKKAQTLKFGLNWFIDGHSSKITLEYSKDFHKESNSDDMIILQAQMAL